MKWCTAVLLAVLAVAPAACSSDDGGETATVSEPTQQDQGGSDGAAAGAGSGASASTAADGTGSAGTVSGIVPDPCGLLTDDEASAALGRAVTGKEANLTWQGEGELRSCTWGEIVDGSVLTVSVGTREPVDYLFALSEATNETSPSDAVEGAQFVPTYVVPGGGGTGATLRLATDRITVLVAAFDEVEQAKVEEAARAVAGRLG